MLQELRAMVLLVNNSHWKNLLAGRREIPAGGCSPRGELGRENGHEKFNG